MKNRKVSARYSLRISSRYSERTVEIVGLLVYNLLINYPFHTIGLPVPVAARSKAWVFGRSPAEIVGSNPTGGHGCLCVVNVVCCQVDFSATD